MKKTSGEMMAGALLIVMRHDRIMSLSAGDGTAPLMVTCGSKVTQLTVICVGCFFIIFIHKAVRYLVISIFNHSSIKTGLGEVFFSS